MQTSDLDNIPDPLTDTFELIELRRIAPWIWEDVQRVGADRLLVAIRQRGADPGQPQMMQTYVAALRQITRGQHGTG
jgi:hypothetical protein